MFFSKPGEYKPAGLFSIGHLILLILTLIGIFFALNSTKNKRKEEVTKIIQDLVIFLWVLELIKIIFNICVGNATNPNTFIPLYYCSIILFAGMFSGFNEGILRHAGDVFIATGAIVGGLCFLVCPNTSLTAYPAFHYISVQSFIFHGAMVYLGILVNITNYIELEWKDGIYYFALIFVISMIALIYNKFNDSNLMFISKNYPGTPVDLIYKLSGKNFTVTMIAIQATLPFIAICGISKLIRKSLKKDMAVT